VETRHLTPEKLRDLQNLLERPKEQGDGDN
jgi:hypothetical protein